MKTKICDLKNTLIAILVGKDITEINYKLKDIVKEITHNETEGKQNKTKQTELKKALVKVEQLRGHNVYEIGVWEGKGREEGEDTALFLKTMEKYFMKTINRIKKLNEPSSKETWQKCHPGTLQSKCSKQPKRK